ncbi:MAG: DUF1553 domain-containing protein [Pirellulaceae bacterium]
MTRLSTIALWIGTFCLLLPASVGATAAEPLQYNRDVRPILADKCFPCHGPDSASRQADLRLDQREAAIEAGVIEPGEPENSELVARIDSDDPDLLMPPPAIHKTLTTAEKDLLQRWVAEGAAYQAHWSFIPPQRPAPPEVQQATWVRNPLDNFVLARLEAMGLSPAPEADRTTLVRRVSLDLTGLPPAPDVVKAFLEDASPDAYEKLVDQLLASDRWGEHRGRYWLDYARYADTHGIHFDNYREMWSYREWIIRAFNANKPFDEFTIESLAGDLLPNATLDQQIASGFNRCNMTTNEGGIIDEEYRVLYTRDRTETTSFVWMGLTANCAVCHDHKFDPLSQREFYALSAFFNNTTQGPRDGNVKDTPPIVTVPQDADRERWIALQQELPAAQATLAARRQAAHADFTAWLATAEPETISSHVPDAELYLHAPLDEGSGTAIRIRVEGVEQSVPLTNDPVWTSGQAAAHALQTTGNGVAELADVGDFAADQAFSYGAWIKLPSQDEVGAIVARMDEQQGYRGWDLWVEQRRVGAHIIHQWSSDALKVVSRDPVPVDRWTHVLVTYDGSRKAAGIQVYLDGEVQATTVQADTLQGDIHTDVPLKIGQRNASESIPGLTLQDLRMYRRALAPQEAKSLAQVTRLSAYLTQPRAELTEIAKSELFDWWLPTLDNPYRERAGSVACLEQEQQAIRARGTIAHVMEERGEPASAHLLERGEYDKPRDSLSPDTPGILPPLPADAPRNRLGFARWLVTAEHPLTARVTVNRFWQEVFGTGLVKTTGDFGVSGELPTHPELLDFLAVDFRENGWDVKRLFKQIVTSATYRQAATITPEKREADPENGWLSRGPRFRMDAEMVRDYALAASGLLVHRIGGPSVKPYQPEGVWEAIAMNVSDTRSYARDSGDNLYRRSLYTFWKRMAPPASMDILNAPSREFCVVRRERTNTPLQALVTLNDEQFIEAARHLAQRTLLEGGNDVERRVQWLALRLLARPLRTEEMAIVDRSLQGLLDYYRLHPQEADTLLTVGEFPHDASLTAVELAAWSMLANELMNLDEVLNK